MLLSFDTAHDQDGEVNECSDSTRSSLCTLGLISPACLHQQPRFRSRALFLLRVRNRSAHRSSKHCASPISWRNCTHRFGIGSGRSGFFRTWALRVVVSGWSQSDRFYGVGVTRRKQLPGISFRTTQLLPLITMQNLCFVARLSLILTLFEQTASIAFQLLVFYSRLLRR